MNFITPCGELVLVSIIRQEALSDGGIHLPESMTKQVSAEEALVVGCGPDIPEEGSVKEGDRVIFPVNTGMDVSFDGEHYRLMSYKSIYAKINDSWDSPKTQREVILG